MRIKERFEDLFQVVSAVCYPFVLKRFLQFLFKAKAVASKVFNVVAGV
jgi:hypothetical protein